jgi:hypothetical protein
VCSCFGDWLVGQHVVRAEAVQDGRRLVSPIDGRHGHQRFPATPRVGDPTYATAILDFVRATAPDTFSGDQVNLGRAFFTTVTPQMAGTADPNILGLLDLEVWGAPISRPMADSSNPKFIYQRFQRGILHYDATTGLTHGILLADYFKSILLGQNLPADLQQQASESRFYAQYAPGEPGWLARPADLQATDLTFAFEQG